MVSSNLHYQHSWKGEMMNLCQSHFGYFFQSIFLAHFWRVLPVPLCLNYLAMPSWDAIIQTLIPCNFHTSVCTLTCLMFTITYGGASSPAWRSETQEDMLQAGGRRALPTIHLRLQHIIITYMIKGSFCIIQFWNIYHNINDILVWALQ